MIEITALFVYPVKSCRGISLREVRVGARGFEHDREFLVVDEANAFLTQRSAPGLALIEAALNQDELQLRAPN
ncbi:MAG: MOSC N-terminal beta barrel domain-containing protein, partial [Chthoniobacterales bacterium]